MPMLLRLRSRKSRILLLWGIVGFFVVQIILGLFFEQSCISICDPEYARHEQRLRERIAEHPERPLLVVFGSSRVSNGVEAQLAEELLGHQWTVFNFGLTTSGPFMQRICYERLRSQGIRPSVVFFEVMPPFFHHRPQPLDLAMLDGARLRFGEAMSLPQDSDALCGPIRKYALARLFPCRRYAENFQEHVHLQHVSPLPAFDVQKSIDGHGWYPVPFEKGIHRPDLIALAHRQYDACYRDFHLAQQQVQRMDALIRSAQNDGAQVGLVLMPEGSEFRKLYSPAMTSQINTLLEHWRSEFHVPIVDGRDWLGDEWFYDMHHLTQTGATTFSNLFQATLARQFLNRDQ